MIDQLDLRELFEEQHRGRQSDEDLPLQDLDRLIGHGIRAQQATEVAVLVSSPRQDELGTWTPVILGTASADHDALMLEAIVVDDPVPAGGDELGVVGDLVDRDETDAERPDALAIALVASGDPAERVKVAPDIGRRVDEPGAHWKLLLAAVAENAVVVHDERVLADLEPDRRRSRGVVGVLD